LRFGCLLPHCPRKCQMLQVRRDPWSPDFQPFFTPPSKK
jgi:hypothetical protein